MLEQDVINIIENLIERLKWEGIERVEDDTCCAVIYSLEDAVLKLKEKGE